MRHGHRGQPPVAQEMAFQDSRGASPDHTATARAILLLQWVVDRWPLERFHIDHRACGATFRFENPAAFRTGRRHADQFHTVGFLGRDACASMSGLSGLGSACFVAGLEDRSIGFNRQLRGRSGGAEEALLGGAFLITQTIFEPSILFAEAINLLLLLQAVRATTQSVEARGLSLGFWTALLPVISKEHRSQFAEQSFQLASVLQTLAQERHQNTAQQKTFERVDPLQD